MTSTTRSRRLRSMSLLIAGVFVGATMLSPAFANHTPTHTAKQVKQLNKKIKNVKKTTYKKKAVDAKDTAVKDGAMKALDDRVEPFSAVMDTNGQEVTLATYGPLLLKAKCLINDGGDDKVRVYFDSTAAGWWWTDNESGDGPNAANVNDSTKGTENTAATGTPEYTSDIDDGSAAVQMNGKVYFLGHDGEQTGLGLNVFGHKCFVIGHASKASYTG